MNSNQKSPIRDDFVKKIIVGATIMLIDEEITVVEAIVGNSKW